MKLSPAQTRLLAKVQQAATEGRRYAVQYGQFPSATVLLRAGLVIDTTRTEDFTKHLSPADDEGE